MKRYKSLIGYPLDIMYKIRKLTESKVWDFVDSYKIGYKVISKEQTTNKNAYEVWNLHPEI